MGANVKSYHRRQQITLAFAAIICMYIITLNLDAVLKPYCVRPPINYESETSMLNYSNARSDVYEFAGDVRIDGTSATIFIASHRVGSITIKPYARKYDVFAMGSVSAFEIKAAPRLQLPRCGRTLDAPAILFSTAGYAANHFHSVTDVLVPLFATSHRFNRRVLFLITDRDSRFTSKHKKALENLSQFDPIDVDAENQTLCFPKLTVGLRSGLGELSIDPSPLSSFSSRNFTRFLRRAYSLEREAVDRRRRRPRLLVVSRNTSRRLTNEEQVVDLARGLGFESVTHDFTREAAKLVSTFDVMVGVHGAGLTNMVFLPENAVVIQIVAVGMETFARCFSAAAPEMKLKYLEHKVSLSESSLLGKYPAHSQILRNPLQFCEKRGFAVCKNVFLDNQDVNLDLPRFRDTLFKALDLLAA